MRKKCGGIRAGRLLCAMCNRFWHIGISKRHEEVCVRLQATARELNYLQCDAPTNSWVCCSSFFCAKGPDIIGGRKAGDCSLGVGLRELDSQSYVRKLPAAGGGRSKWKQKNHHESGVRSGLKEQCKGDCHWHFMGLLELNWKVSEGSLQSQVCST